MGTAARETSTYDGQPIELYQFTAGARVWRYTSADTPVTHNGSSYIPATIVRDTIGQSDQDGSGSVEVSLTREDPVAALFVGGGPAAPVLLTIFRTHRGESDALTIFVGEVGSAEFDGPSVRLLCGSVFDRLAQQFPRGAVQSTCPKMLGDSDCGVDLSPFTAPFDIVAVTTGADGTQTLEFDLGAGTVADGYYTAGVAILGEARGFIVGQVNQVGSIFGVTLMVPLPGVAAGVTVFLQAGCDRTTGSNGCAKFSNIARYGGFPGLPSRNPFSGFVVGR